MAIKYVDLKELNFRSTPVVNPASLIDTFYLGQSVDELGPLAAAPDWLEVEAEITGVMTKGLVKAEINGLPTLRNPVSDAREALVAQAIQEWLRFDKGEGQEDDDPYFKFVGQMWKAIGNNNLTGKDRKVAWSAAAISFMVRNAGATVPNYLNFKFAEAHHEYMHDSIVQRKAKNTTAPFWGFQRDKKSPEIGDIVGKWREAPSTFANAEAGDNFSSHCDIIVSVRTDFVLAIGGNVNQSVNITRYTKTPSGFLGNNETFNKNGKKTGAVIIHMVNQTG